MVADPSFKVSNEQLLEVDPSFDQQDLGLTSALSMAENLTDEQISGFQDHRSAFKDLPGLMFKSLKV